MKIRHTFAMAGILVWAVCPTLFALENGRQVAVREVARLLVKNTVSPVRTVAPSGDSLLQQIAAMNVGEVTISGKTVTVMRPEATYVFDLSQFFRRMDGGVSGTITVRDNQNGEIGEIFLSEVRVVDDNRIDFSVELSAPNEQRTENGAMIGLGPGKAVVITSVNGGETYPSLINFDSPAIADSSAVAATTASSGPVIVTTTPMITTDSEIGSAAGFWAWLSCSLGWTVCTVIIVATVVFIGATCLAFGWWGCDN